MTQRVLACTTCHGKQGRAAPDGYYPRIAGKPAGYLYNQLLNFRDGRRHYGLMDELVAPLSDAYLREIAEHFAALDLPYAAPPPGSASSALLQRGQDLATLGDPGRRLPACVQCHGAKLTGLAPAIPGLLGLPRDYLNGQLGAWKSGQRHAHTPDCMGQIAKTLSLDDIAAVSQWLAAQPLPAAPKAVAELPAPLPLSCGGVPQAHKGQP
ncbi:MAG: cytochrome c4 [Burkholderiaceae bacterium]|nr:cytochrome c4 [Burkholderiaceae bacterium]